jgi:hypothetical protein
MTPAALSPRNPPHSRTLGACWIIYGVFRVAIAIWLAVFAPTATVMFGALLTRVPEPFSLMAAFHLLYLVVLVWAGASGVVGLLAGVALLTSRRAGSALVRLAAYLSVGDAPLGTTLSIYTLTVLPPAVVTEASLHAQRAA